ncbi:MAG: helix-turn-helix transcriptional regulator [Bacilli bacterium]|nr:helix-turn-helix transcriptional regulator [Bacilli bacterium]
MDLIKIGRFIADCRKEKEITQEQLAEKLYITDRAVSKWERGLSLPDADKMLELCNILDVSVNELLNGEKIMQEDYERKTEELLVEFTKKDEEKDKQLFTNMWVLLISTFIFYITILILGAITLGEGIPFGIITVVSTIIFVCVGFYALKIEVDIGYYECRKCYHKFKPSYLTALIAPHAHTTRYLKCPECGKRTMAKKVLK